MKRPIRNVQLKLQSNTFELLKNYKEICGLANLSEAVEKIVFYHLPLEEDHAEEPQAPEELTLEDNIPAPEKKTVTSLSGKESLQVETGIPIPQISKQRVSFSHLIENTLKKMKVGNSFIIKGENQRSMSLGVAKKLKITLATRQTDSFKKDQTIRVWRVA